MSSFGTANPLSRRPKAKRCSIFSILAGCIFVALLFEVLEVTSVVANGRLWFFDEPILNVEAPDLSGTGLNRPLLHSSHGANLAPKRKVAICVVLLDGHIGSHKVYGNNTLKNDIDAEAFVDSVGVLRLAFDTIGSKHFDLDFLAVVVDSPKMKNLYPKLEAFGWTVVDGVMPVSYDDIQESYYKENVNISGCCGMNELLKLNVFNMTDYYRVSVVDADVLVAHPLDELWAAPEWLSLIYTRGQMKGEPFQGGLWTIRPNPNILAHMVDLVKRGAWYPGSGWEHSGVGWVYGGPTVQGIMPYYFTKVAPPTESMAVSVCHYNHMGSLPRCADTPTEQIRSFHFTGGCSKAFRCNVGTGACKDFTDRWWNYSRILERKMGYPERPRCPNGHYIPISDRSRIDDFKQKLNVV